MLLAHDRFWLLAGAFSGFLVVAPVLATSLYAISRALERGEPVNLRLIIKTWTRWQYSRYAVSGGYWSLVRFGLLLDLAGTGWVLTSAALITPLAAQPIHTPLDFLHHVVLAGRKSRRSRILRHSTLVAYRLARCRVLCLHRSPSVKTASG